MKKDGATCWVATSSPKCLAVSSTDTAPALISLDASVTLLNAAGSRSIPVQALYQNDGIHYLTRRGDEILTAVELPQRDGWRSTYWKLRRRGSFDFPVLSVAAAVNIGRNGVVDEARIVLGAVASHPIVAGGCRCSFEGRTIGRRADCHSGQRRGAAGKADGQYRFHVALAKTHDDGVCDVCAARTAGRRHAGDALPDFEAAAIGAPTRTLSTASMTGGG